MKAMIATIAIFWGSVAAAHPGHLIEVAGHGHWLAGAAIGLAIAIGLAQGLRGKKGDDAEEGETAEPQEA